MAFALTLLFPVGTGAQIINSKLKKENEDLKAEVDSLKRVIEDLRNDIILRDSIANEMMKIFEENEAKGSVGLDLDEYNPEVTDSLLNIWYLHRQVNEDIAADSFDMDSIRFNSDVSDEVMKERLEKMNSFITLPYNEKVRNYMVLY